MAICPRGGSSCRSSIRPTPRRRSASDAESLAYCDRLAERAIELWGTCMASGEWPGYQTKIAHVAEMPAWMRVKGEAE